MTPYPMARRQQPPEDEMPIEIGRIEAIFPESS
jgi:hypothetical protein